MELLTDGPFKLNILSPELRVVLQYDPEEIRYYVELF